MQTAYSLNVEEVSVNKLQVSGSYKKQVASVFFSIIAFFVVYVLLMVAAIALAVGCVYAAGFVIMIHPSFITLSIGFGLLLLALSVFVFLVKFIFSSTKSINQLRVQVKENDQPELFAFVRSISKETETKFPKKIFISPEVNACVFYNSSFWSMIFPVRKNLELGVGLVNVLNVSELEAVIAHEFGHFSQRSMKLGSFTYNVNKVIYNMLYNNEGYGNFLNSWARLGNVASFFATITVKIAEAIQWVLKEMYQLINKNYMSLSREMEYHADAVAASVAGGNNLVTALARIEMADNCYQQVLTSADGWLKEKKIARNLFSHQQLLLKSAKQKSTTSSRINFKDQWASHPSFEDRKQHLEQLRMDRTPNEAAAWTMFRDPEALQQEMTTKLYQNVPMEESEWIECDASDFETWHSGEQVKFELPALYNGFYDNRFIDIAKWDVRKLSADSTDLTFEQLFAEGHQNLETKIQTCNNDIVILEAIRDKKVVATSFDFEGEKHNAEYATYLVPKMQEELKELQNKQSDLDVAAFRYFVNQPASDREKIMDSYLEFQDRNNDCAAFNTIAQKVFETVAPLYQQGNTIQFVIETIERLRMEIEPGLKNLLRQHLCTPAFLHEISTGAKERLEIFIGKKNLYYEDDQFKNEELDDLQYVISTATELLDDIKFKAYKQVLLQQLDAFVPQLN